jgi:RNA polymerase sigma factor (sigma-70 family)
MTLLLHNRDLLDRFRRKDKDALSAVFYHYVDFVEGIVRSGFHDSGSGRYVYGITDPDMVRDLVQTVFSRAFSPGAVLAYDGIRPYRNYLATIARNVFIDFYRKRTRDPLAYVVTPFEALSDVADESSDSPEPHQAVRGPAVAFSETDLHWKRCLAVAEQYIETLPEEMRRFVELRYRQSLAQAAVAQQMKISRWRVRYFEMRLESGLRRCLQKRKMLD